MATPSTSTTPTTTRPDGLSISREVDPDRLEALVGQVVGDLGAALAVPLVHLGDRLGIFPVLAGAGTTTAAELARRTGLHERYLQEWLLAMAASGYVDAVDGGYRMTDEQAEALTNPDSPAYVAGGFQVASAALRSADRLAEAFRTGAGMAWGEHHPDLFEGTERFFRPSYLAHLTTEWVPALEGLQERLQQGATVADVGCGHGASTVLLAQAYPSSTFVGVDAHPESVQRAGERAAAAGLGERVSFVTTGATDLQGSYDLVAMFDCLHDMPDPLGALRAARRAVVDDGWVMLVEPMSGDTAQDALNPVGRLYAAASVFVCLPSGLSAEPRTGLGNQAGPARTLALAREAGFSRAREATRTPFNIVYELRP